MAFHQQKLERTISKKIFLLTWYHSFTFLHILLFPVPCPSCCTPEVNLVLACDIFPQNEKSIWLAIAHQWGGLDFWCLIVLSQVWKGTKKYENCICRAHQCMSVVWLKHGFLNSPLLRFESTLPYSFVHLCALFYILFIVASRIPSFPQLESNRLIAPNHNCRLSYFSWTKTCEIQT